MALEIERKFLVVGDDWRAQVSRAARMRQGYLSREAGRASVRVRVEDDRATLNIKAAVVGSARAEYEYAIPVGEACELLETLCVGRLEKIRHYIERDGIVWEVDEFTGDNAGLIVAEVELSAVDQAFVRPQWLGRELTDDRRYYNHHLALHPYRSWDADAH
ncbi:CYTH domain-containing protein [Sinimarinibacterium flocculans]|uniref:Adenylate cyclase n=1 Tax=Sinimarinibacterium flocculans TaxID=985250 RepID=A0A318EGZ4_9GAMM|nr:CYTH domain-containing protein [Sinimarinibacterium flocculans]PXV71498.1 adenylate cyclase [Sinimarinibacterium flocculans]